MRGWLMPFHNRDAFRASVCAASVRQREDEQIVAEARGQLGRQAIRAHRRQRRARADGDVLLAVDGERHGVAGDGEPRLTSHSTSPVRWSNARNRPFVSPPNTRPPAVDISDIIPARCS